MKASDFPKEVLIEELVKKIKQEVMQKMPRLANEPFSEYNDHIREEVEFTACSLVSDECKRKFEIGIKKWNGF